MALIIDDPETEALVQVLAEHLQKSMSLVVKQALLEQSLKLARNEGAASKVSTDCGFDDEIAR